MDEKQKILEQLPELSKAQAALMNMRPPGVSEFQRLATRISDLQFRLFALAGQQLRTLKQEEVTRLRNAVQQLQTAVNASVGATQILAAATTLANA
jgi:hypothetical protein